MNFPKCAFVAVLSGACVIAPLAALADEAGEAAKEGLKQLEGVWILKERTSNGKETPKEQLKTILGGQIAIKGDSLKMGKITAKIVIDRSAKPNAIDRMIKKPDGQDLKTPGIYELNGDTLKICWPAPLAKRERPKELKSGDGVVMEVYERKKD